MAEAWAKWRALASGENGEMRDPVSTQPAHLLVVEDDDTIRETVSEALELEGYRVTAATNGRSALDLLQRQRFELVLLDLMLPGLHGLELFRLLHPALVVSETSNHSKEQKPAILSRCLQMAIESETYE